jgi:N-acyl-D-amino-acid deacylase
MDKKLIRHALIVDGTGHEPFTADVVIAGDRIESVGDISPAAAAFETVIEADGLVLSPGFIDMHSHSDLIQMVRPDAPAKIRQGITTELLGQDGLGVAPIAAATVTGYRRLVAGLLGDPPLSWKWRSFGGYLQELERRRTATNLAALVSHGPLRLATIGSDERPASRKEVAAMAALAARAFAEGAYGFSTGLIYPPCVFAGQDELIELARATAAADGIYVVHVRNERSLVKESINEIFAIARQTGVAPHISHLKVIGRENWGTAADILALFDQASAENLDASFDQYPYPAGSTMLSALLPPHAHAGGPEALLRRLESPEMRQRLAREMAKGLDGWENIASAAGWDGVLVTGIEDGPNKAWEGVSLAEIASQRGITPQETVFDLLTQENLKVSMVNFSMSEADVRTIIRHYRGMLGTDGLLLGKPHPRAYGSTARILQKYVREESVLTLAEAIARMTGRPAARLGLTDRGVIRPGAYADLVLFDAGRIVEGGDFVDPCRHPLGIEYVLVNGSVAVERGAYTGALAGKVLRKKKRNY